MRGTAIHLLLAAAALADPFLPTREELHVDDATYARYVETLALLKASLDRDAAGSLERALDMLERFGLEGRLEEPIAKALEGAKEEGPARAGLLALHAHLMVAKGAQAGNVWVFGPNGDIRREGIDADTKKMVGAAADMLREAIRSRPKDARAKEDLATALDLIDSEKNATEVGRLRMEAAGLRVVAGQPPPEPPHTDDAERLRNEAAALEQKPTEPDHARALLLRKEALVRDFCAGTIPVEYDPALYGTVSLLASEDVVQRNLTRTFLKRDGTVESVPPRYHPAKPARRVELAQGLGRDPGPAAGAALLKLLATAHARDTVTAAALKGLAEGKHEAVRRHLPALLAATVYREDGMLDALMAELNDLRRQLRALGMDEPPMDATEGGYGPVGQALLIEAAVALDVKEAAPVLATLLPLESDLLQPRGIAAAVGRLGGAAQADALLAIARDPRRDIYFRREAIVALGRAAPARLAEVPAEPTLDLAIAAARYRAEPSEALKGRLLQGLGQPHEADDAARYLLDLGVAGAVPEIERFLEEHEDHYAAPLIRAMLAGR